MDKTCKNCKEPQANLIECAAEGENVCSSCGWCDPDLVYSHVPQNSKELFNAEKHYYVRKPKRGKDYSFLLGSSSRSSGQYDRRYYWNERFGQWQNRCPLIPQNDLVKIALPLNMLCEGSVSRFFMYDPLLLTRDDVSELCHYANLSRHAEKWIQIKWCLTNFPLEEYQEQIDNGEPIPIQRRTGDFLPSWRWQPDFLPDSIHQKLARFLDDIRLAFIDVQSKFFEIEEMQPYARKSFINFDFVMLRGLYMLCDQCPWESHNKCKKCWVTKYSWALKSLNTPKNIRDHVAWFYFLVGEMAKKTLYEHPSTRSVKKWEICPSDTILTDEKYKPKCPLLLKAIIPPTFNPDLAARPLKRLDTRYRLPLGLGGSHHRSDIEMYQKPTSSTLPC